MIMPFGKHIGKDVKELPPAYLRWLLNNLSLTDQLEKAVRDALAEIALLVLYRKELYIDEALLDQWLDIMEFTPAGSKPSWTEFQLQHQQG